MDANPVTYRRWLALQFVGFIAIDRVQRKICDVRAAGDRRAILTVNCVHV